MTPHHIDKGVKSHKLSFYGEEVLPCEVIRNIGPIADSTYPLKGQSRWVPSGRTHWIGQAKTRKQMDIESSKADIEGRHRGGHHQQEPKPLAPVKKRGVAQDPVHG